MLRKLVATALLASTLALSSCAGKSAATVVSEIQQATVAACSFLPTAATVINILAAGNPAVTGVSDVAAAICTALTVRGSRKRGAASVTERNTNVVIHGRFVR